MDDHFEEASMNPFQRWQKRRVIFLTASFIGLSFLWAGQGNAAKKGMPASVQDNMTVEFEYTLTVDGAVVDSSKGQDPMRYVHGQGQIVPGLEKELTGLQVGDAKQVTVKPQDAYGQMDPEAFIEVPKSKLPKEPAPEVGMILSGQDPEGRPFQAKIAEVKADSVKLDMNHPLAGKTLNFEVKVTSITPPSE